MLITRLSAASAQATEFSVGVNDSDFFKKSVISSLVVISPVIPALLRISFWLCHFDPKSIKV
jgi:hypothetical protein